MQGTCQKKGMGSKQSKIKVVKKEHRSGKCKDSVKNSFTVKKENSEEKQNTDKNEDDKLRVTIFTNKEPIIDKVDGEGNEINKRVTKRNFCSKITKVCQYFDRRRQVSIPYSEWQGKVQCKIVKKVKTFSNKKNYKVKGKTK